MPDTVAALRRRLPDCQCFVTEPALILRFHALAWAMLRFGQALSSHEEIIMLVRRRVWFYRLAGERFAHAITFRIPMTAAKVKAALGQTVGIPAELWGRSA